MKQNHTSPRTVKLLKSCHRIMGKHFLFLKYSSCSARFPNTYSSYEKKRWCSAMTKLLKPISGIKFKIPISLSKNNHISFCFVFMYFSHIITLWETKFCIHYVCTQQVFKKKWLLWPHATIAKVEVPPRPQEGCHNAHPVLYLRLSSKRF